MVPVPTSQGAGIVLYLLAMSGISFVSMKLLSVVAEQTIAIVLPNLESGPPKISLVEQRRIDATLSLPPLSALYSSRQRMRIAIEKQNGMTPPRGG